MIKNYFKLTLTVAAAFLWCHPLFCEFLQDFDAFIENQRKEYKVPGAAVAIVKDDKIIFAKGYGVCRYDKPEKVDADTIFQLASVSKTFASAGLAIQVDQKRLSWDEEINLHLPQFALKEPYATRYATSRDLLAHRTGLPAFGGDLLSKIGYTREQILSRVRFIEPASSFRNKAYYSNGGFFIAGELLAKLSNSSWEAAIQSTLLDPLKMTRSGFAANLDKTNVASAHAFVNGEMQIIPRDTSVLFAAAGGVTSTAADMGRWIIMQLNEGAFEGKQVIKPESIREMHLPSMVAEVTFSELPPIDAWSGFSFGLGWDNYHYKGQFIVEKAGALDGVRSVVTLIPGRKAGIVILANLNLTVYPELIRAKFLESELGQYANDLLPEFAKQEQSVEEIILAPRAPKNQLPFGHKLSQYTGSFENDLYGDFVVSQEYDQLLLEAGPGKLKGKLKHWSNDTFLLTWPAINTGNELVTFTFGPEGNAIEMQTETLGAFHLKKTQL